MADDKKPAKKVIDAFGGTSKTAQILKCDKSTVSCWLTRGKGLIPAQWQGKILTAAKEHGIDISPADLVDTPDAVA